MENDGMSEIVHSYFEESLDCARIIAKDTATIEKIVLAARVSIDSLKSGGKIIFMGNGGSAADSQHLATELVSRYKVERRAISALALTVDSSVLTAIANDYEFERVFSRQIQAMARSGDIVVGISTSGNSLNVINGLKEAKNMGCKTISFTGIDGGNITEVSDLTINAPSSNTPVIQQSHITFGHAICDLIENAIAQ